MACVFFSRIMKIERAVTSLLSWISLNDGIVFITVRDQKLVKTVLYLHHNTLVLIFKLISSSRITTVVYVSFADVSGPPDGCTCLL